MISDDLKNILEQQSVSKNAFFTRSLLKEALQNYVLNFVYNDPDYKTLIFTGGTCLRKIYGLPRLSEDLDFNFTDEFEIEKFTSKITRYLIEEISYKEMTTKISGNGKTVFLKFPINFGNSPVLFVRCDFCAQKPGSFKTEINSISAGDFTIFVLAYDLATLFTNKITAFIERVYFKGNKQAVPFKGRDLFDIVWFLERSKRANWSLKPDIKNSQKIDLEIIKKVEKINKEDVYRDLLPFIESSRELDNFVANFKTIIKENIKFVL